MGLAHNFKYLGVGRFMFDQAFQEVVGTSMSSFMSQLIV